MIYIVERKENKGAGKNRIVDGMRVIKNYEAEDFTNMFKYQLDYADNKVGEYDETAKYKCVICGKEVGLSDSCSNKGHKLCCLDCVTDKHRFPTYLDFREWCNLR